MNTMTKWLGIFMLVASPFLLSAQDEISEADLQELQKIYMQIDSINGQFTYDSGTVTIGDNLATIQVPAGFKYLDPKQTKVVLEEVWGNPADNGYLGMLFPADLGPVSIGSWAINISFEREGYVNDDDAKDINYDDLLAEMKESSSASNQARVEQGYEPIEFVGWAKPPYYDEKQHKLFWAQEIKFGTETIEGNPNTLNYNIRILGRKGILVLNAIATMDEIGEIDNNLDKILASVDFQQGERYQDFDADIDEVAAYGIGGLIAGKVLAKAGFFAVIAKFGKFIFVGLIAVFAGIRKFFFGSKE